MRGLSVWLVLVPLLATRHGNRIVPESWIAESTAPQINGEGVFFYGYQWWLGRSWIERREIDWIAGVGLGGQRLFVVPDRDL
jgi:CubicO group peptidase (beta-lactamase class C family)